MKKTFTNFSERWMADTTAPAGLLDDLRATESKLCALVKGARNPTCSDVPSVSDDVTQRLSAVAYEDAVPVKAPSQVSRVASTRPQHWQEEPVKTISAVWGYTFGSEDPSSSEDLDDTTISTSHQITTTWATQPHYNLAPSSTPLQSQTLSRSVTPPLRPLSRLPTLTSPYTYSFQETTFARRLHRACLELGYQLSLDPSRRPNIYERVFKLCLASIGGSREKLIQRFRDLLKKGTRESLRWEEAAFVHVGGAGMHYPRAEGEEGGFDMAVKVRGGLKRDDWVRSMGPQRLFPNGTTADVALDIPGYEGEWFDPEDVEGYLAEKGIFIEPQSSYAEIEMPIVGNDLLPPSPPETQSERASSSQPSLGLPDTPPTVLFDVQQGKQQQQQQYQPQNGGSLPQSGNIDILASTSFDNIDFSTFDLSSVGYSDASTGSFMNFLPSTQYPDTTTNTAATTNVPITASTLFDKAFATPNPSLPNPNTNPTTFPAATTTPAHFNLDFAAEYADLFGAPSESSLFGSSDNATAMLSFDFMGPGGRAQGLEKQKQRVTIDVAKMIKGMFVHMNGVCSEVLCCACNLRVCVVDWLTGCVDRLGEHGCVLGQHARV